MAVQILSSNKIEVLFLERLSDQCTDLFFVAERRLSLGRRFNAGWWGEWLSSRGATVEIVVNSSPPSTVFSSPHSTVAPRLGIYPTLGAGVKTPA